MDRDYVIAPQVVDVEFALYPVLVQLDSLSLINQVDSLSGFSDWVMNTRAAMTPEQLREHLIVFEVAGVLFYMAYPPLRTQRTLLEYVDWLAAHEPATLRDQMMATWAQKMSQHPEWWRSEEPVPNAERLTHDRDTFVRFFSTACDEIALPASVWETAFALVQTPDQLMSRVYGHIRSMWDQFLRDEWMRVLPMLQESVKAFQRQHYHNLTVYEAIRAVTGRDMTGKMDDMIAGVERILFMPSPHLGPYISKFPLGDALYLMFSARLPRGVQSSASALSRSELLIRMNALADDTRLLILEMLTRQEELCAQEIIEALKLSQSSVSRHLSQLSATGFLTERRRDANKCYSLNTDRIVDTIQALTYFLSRR